MLFNRASQLQDVLQIETRESRNRMGCYWLEAAVLWEKDCAFCVSNAASNEVTAIPIQNRKGPAAFNRLFEEFAGKPIRAELGISDDCPTNPQAEVLVFGNIESSYIIGAVAQKKETAESLKVQYPNFQFVYHRALFFCSKRL